MTVQEYLTIQAIFAATFLFLFILYRFLRYRLPRRRRLSILENSLYDMEDTQRAWHFEVSEQLKKLRKRVRFLESLNAVKPKKKKQ